MTYVSNTMKNCSAFRTWATLFCVAVLALAGCKPSGSAAPKHFGGVIDNLGGVTLNASGLHMNSKKITNGANGTAATDFATFGQVPIVGGNFFPSLNTFSRIREDWDTITTQPINGTQLVGSGWTCVIVGTGVGSIPASTATSRGVLRFSTGAGTTGSYGFTAGGGNNKAWQLNTSDAIYLATKRSVSAVSNGTDTYTTYFGFSASSTTVDATTAYVIGSDIAVDATHYVLKSISSGVATNTVTTATITAGQTDIIEVVKLSGTNTATVYVNGTSVGTNGALPTGAVMTEVNFITKSAGTTAVTMDEDYNEIQVIEPSKRAASFLP